MLVGSVSLLYHSPERWINPPEAVSAIPGMWSNLLTFIGGPHSCIGYRFSIIECVLLHLPSFPTFSDVGHPQDESAPPRAPLRLRIRARRAEGVYHKQDVAPPEAPCLDRDREGEPDATPRHAGRARFSGCGVSRAGAHEDWLVTRCLNSRYRVYI